MNQSISQFSFHKIMRHLLEQYILLVYYNQSTPILLLFFLIMQLLYQWMNQVAIHRHRFYFIRIHTQYQITIHIIDTVRVLFSFFIFLSFHCISYTTMNAAAILHHHHRLCFLHIYTPHQISVHIIDIARILSSFFVFFAYDHTTLNTTVLVPSFSFISDMTSHRMFAR